MAAQLDLKTDRIWDLYKSDTLIHLGLPAQIGEVRTLCGSPSPSHEARRQLGCPLFLLDE